MRRPLERTVKIAILDDYLRLALASANWSPLADRCEITVFDRPLAHAEAC